MPEEDGSPGAGEGSADDAQGDQSEGSQDAGQGSEDRNDLTPDQLRQMLREANAESARRKRELRALQTKVQEFETANLTEAERLKKEADELRAQNEALTKAVRDRDLRDSFSAEATRLGFINPTVAYRLVDPKQIEFDDDGKPKNAADLLAELIKSEPYLVKRGSVDAGSRGSSDAPDMNDLIRRQAGRGA